MEEVGHKFTFDQILTGYRKEIEGLVVIANSGFLQRNLTVFENYQASIAEAKRNSTLQKILKRLQAGNSLINIEKQSSEMTSIFYLAHLATCCALFNGWKLPLDGLRNEHLDALVVSELERIFRKNGGSLKPFEESLQLADAVRVVNILRLSGLLALQSKDCCQLSIGAGGGTRDIDAFHFVPKIRIIDSAGVSMGNTRNLELSVIGDSPREVVLVDGDPAFAERYEYLNADTSKDMKLLAMNMFLDEAFDRLPARVDEEGMHPFNLIIGYRIDQCMIPDVGAFFSQLAALMADVAQLVITIGAGHTLDEFIGREAKIAELAAYLKKKGMHPYRIRMSYGSSVKERRLKPAFGLGPITSYEILYCKLKRKFLSR